MSVATKKNGLRKCNVCVSLCVNEWKIITYKWAMIFMAGCGYEKKNKIHYL